MLRDLLVNSQAMLGLRESAAITLANLERPKAQDAVLEAMPTAPERLQSTIAAALVRRREGAGVLLKAIEAGKASARLLQERRVVIGLENAEIPHLSERIAALLKGLPPADQKLRDLMAERREAFLHAAADASRGARVFEKTCATAISSRARAAGLVPSSTASAAAGSSGCWKMFLTPIATWTRASASPISPSRVAR